MIKQATEPTEKKVLKDGDIDAVVIRIRDTGSSTVIPAERYRHTIYHGLGRVPVGCQVILSDKVCNVFVEYKDKNKINVAFTAEHADVNVRVW